MAELQHPDIIAEGKTKIVRRTANPKVVVVESKDDITAGDGARRAVMDSKAHLANLTTCNVFELLNRKGLRTHFIRKGQGTSFTAFHLDMIPFEVVIRRIAYGSYLKRRPEVPERTVFETLVVEFFWKDDSRHDPLIKFDFANGRMILFDAKAPEGSAPIGEENFKDHLVGGRLIDEHIVIDLTAQALHTFLYLEEAWHEENVVLVDIKFEFGLDLDGKVLLGDVVDNDSWRIWPGGRKEDMLDKQVFRDLSELTEADMKRIKGNYAKVAEMTSRFVERLRA